MKTAQMLALVNVVFIAIVALTVMLWPWIGAVVGYGNSWWLAPLAAFGGFLIAGRLLREANRDLACRAQIAIFGVFCVATLLWNLLIQHLGIPAWRVGLTFVLASTGTWLGRLALGGEK